MATTTINVTPSSQTVSPGQSFSIDIDVNPGEPINGLALALSYDASLVHAEEVTEGDLFEPYTTFFNAGTIDNTACTITSIYGFTIPATNTVEDPGTFCTISFTAQSSTGTSTLHMYDVCITDVNGECITDVEVKTSITRSSGLSKRPVSTSPPAM